MGRRRADNTLEAFNSKAAGEGLTYAEAQIRETKTKMQIDLEEDGS